MKRILSTVAALSATVISAGDASAQGRAAQCQTSTSLTSPDYYSADACEKAIDLFNYMAPQLGTAIAGGSTVMGKGATLGGVGHFSIGFRANALVGTMPKVDADGVRPEAGGPQQDSYETSTRYIPMPVADIALGLFKGIPVGVTRVGGIDLLANVAYLPDVGSEGDDVRVSVDGSNLKVGYGARVGLVGEGLAWPGVSVSYMRRDLPVVNITAQEAGSELRVNKLDLQTTALRLTASKTFLLVGVHAGVGQDRYESSATARGTVSSGVAGIGTVSSDEIALSQTLTRTNLFAGFSFNLPLVKFGAEVGRVSGGDVATYNSFDTKPDAARMYLSAGMRFGF